MYSLVNLTYDYRRGARAVNDITAEIGPGLHLLLGENGAGKTTLLHLLSGLLFPTEGSCAYNGTELSLRRPHILRDIFFMPDDFECAFSTISRMARCHGRFYPNFNYELMYANLADFGLTGNERIRTMSLGMRRKAYISYALALRTPVLLLDEPANGMDIDAKKILRRVLTRSIGDDSTVIISTHNVYDLGSLFENVMIMHAGRLRLSMPVWQVLERVAFVTSSSPVPGALYQEPDRGRFMAIIPNTDCIDTDIDYRLLYSAAMSPAGDALVAYITTTDQDLRNDR